MGAELARRVKVRLATLRLRPSQVDRMAELSVGFTRDLLAGRKSQPRQKGLQRLAEVLECDVGYLLLEQRVPRRTDGMSDIFPLLGRCEIGVWRTKSVHFLEMIGFPCPPREEYRPEHQGVYEVMDDHAVGLGIADGSRVQALEKQGMIEEGFIPVAGNIVVIERFKEDVAETSIAELSGDGSAIRRGASVEQRIESFEVRALVLTSTLRFL